MKKIRFAAAVGCIGVGLLGSNPASAAPEPSLVGLCHAFPAVANSHGRALDNPAFTTLITAAGGADNVAAYCQVLLA